MACVVATKGAILEVGTGHWSTPLLHRYCSAGGRKLVSVDSDKAWVEQFADMRVCDHEVLHVNYDEFFPKAIQKDWSVVFLDQSPGHRRSIDAIAFLPKAEFILVHDYSGEEVYAPFRSVLSRWKYYKVAQFSPSTLVLSNTREIPFE